MEAALQYNYPYFPHWDDTSTKFLAGADSIHDFNKTRVEASYWNNVSAALVTALDRLFPRRSESNDYTSWLSYVTNSGVTSASNVEDQTVDYFEAKEPIRLKTINKITITYRDVIDTIQGYIDAGVDINIAIFRTNVEFDQGDILEIDLADGEDWDLNYEQVHKKYIGIFLLNFFFMPRGEDNAAFNSSVPTYISFDAGSSMPDKIFGPLDQVINLVTPLNIADSATTFKHLGGQRNYYYFPSNYDGNPDKWDYASNIFTWSDVEISVSKAPGAPYDSNSRFDFSLDIGLRNPPNTLKQAFFDSDQTSGPGVDYLSQIINFRDPVNVTIPNKTLDISTFYSTHPFGANENMLLFDIKRSGDAEQCRATKNANLAGQITRGRSILSTIDRLCSLQSRMMESNTIYHYSTKMVLYRFPIDLTPFQVLEKELAMKDAYKLKLRSAIDCLRDVGRVVNPIKAGITLFQERLQLPYDTAEFKLPRDLDTVTQVVTKLAQIQLFKIDESLIGVLSEQQIHSDSAAGIIDDAERTLDDDERDLNMARYAADQAHGVAQAQADQAAQAYQAAQAAQAQDDQAYYSNDGHAAEYAAQAQAAQDAAEAAAEAAHQAATQADQAARAATALLDTRMNALKEADSRVTIERNLITGLFEKLSKIANKSIDASNYRTFLDTLLRTIASEKNGKLLFQKCEVLKYNYDTLKSLYSGFSLILSLDPTKRNFSLSNMPLLLEREQFYKAIKSFASIVDLPLNLNFNTLANVILDGNQLDDQYNDDVSKICILLFSISNYEFSSEYKVGNYIGGNQLFKAFCEIRINKILEFEKRPLRSASPLLVEPPGALMDLVGGVKRLKTVQGSEPEREREPEDLEEEVRETIHNYELSAFTSFTREMTDITEAFFKKLNIPNISDISDISKVLPYYERHGFFDDNNRRYTRKAQMVDIHVEHDDDTTFEGVLEKVKIALMNYEFMLDPIYDIDNTLRIRRYGYICFIVACIDYPFTLEDYRTIKRLHNGTHTRSSELPDIVNNILVNAEFTDRTMICAKKMDVSNAIDILFYFIVSFSRQNNPPLESGDEEDTFDEDTFHEGTELASSSFDKGSLDSPKDGLFLSRSKQLPSSAAFQMDRNAVIKQKFSHDLKLHDFGSDDFWSDDLGVYQSGVVKKPGEDTVMMAQDSCDSALPPDVYDTFHLSTNRNILTILLLFYLINNLFNLRSTAEFNGPYEYNKYYNLSFGYYKMLMLPDHLMDHILKLFNMSISTEINLVRSDLTHKNIATYIDLDKLLVNFLIAIPRMQNLPLLKKYLRACRATESHLSRQLSTTTSIQMPTEISAQMSTEIPTERQIGKRHRGGKCKTKKQNKTKKQTTKKSKNRRTKKQTIKNSKNRRTKKRVFTK